MVIDFPIFTVFLILSMLLCCTLNYIDATLNFESCLKFHYSENLILFKRFHVKFDVIYAVYMSQPSKQFN
jgi:hypothetical protein